MTRALTATLTALCIASYIVVPALADDATTANAASNTASSAASATTTDVTNANDTGSKTAIADKTSDAAGTDSVKTDDNNDKKSIADNSNPKDPSTKPAGKTGSKGGNVSIPERAAAFTAGVVVGTPIAILRRTHMEMFQAEHDLIGDYDTWWKKAIFVFPGILMAVPFGGISGGLGGCMYSVKNAWAGSADQPFGKDSFSLGDIGN